VILTGTHRWLTVMAILAGLLLSGATPAMAEDPPQPQTVVDPEITIEELELLLKPLPKAQLLVEADAWQALLQAKAEEIARVEVTIKRGNQEIARAEETRDLAAEAKAQLDKAATQTEAAAAEGDAKAAAKAEKASEEAQKSIDQLDEAAADTAAADAARAVLQDDTASIEEKSRVLESAADTVAREADAKKESKVTLLEQVALLREERTALVDRLRTVLDELERKTDEADSDTMAKVRDLRLYAKAVSGIKVDVEDTTSAWIAVKGWLLSDEGGKRWAFNIAKFLVIVFAAWIISRMLSSGVRHALTRVEGTSRLLENFLVNAVRWIVMAIGLIMALSALEVSIGPLLAVVGAAGFVIAFALQDSLSNFASGLMILFFRPFDEGDVIDAGGVSGKVQSMNLVSTTILTFDNKRMVVPNNKIWNDVITNATGVTERRVDMEFGIGYDDDIDKAHDILVDIISSHPKVLKEPEPTIRMNALADSSVNFIARPWARTADYWDVYWDVTRAVKQRFDAAGIGIPFPQRDVHLYIEGGDSRAAAALLSRDETPRRRDGQDKTVREDGGLDDEDTP
jgi:small conductance mechanosensitive channel